MACGGGDDSNEPEPNPTPTPTPSPTPVVNGNKNDASANAYLARLEMPKTKSGSQVITHATDNYGVTYSLEWDSSKKAQRWTCYDLTARTVETNGNSRAKLWPDGDPWNYDPDVPQSEQQAVYNELSKSYYPGYNNVYFEKGHICPSVDRLYTKDANEQTYFMTNIMPMVHNFNGGIWLAMEMQVNTWAKSVDTLFVCKGGTIDNENHVICKTINGHPVPRYYFMALLAKKGSDMKMLGFWVEHVVEDHSKDALKGYVYNIDELEQKTGIDFFCNLPDDVEETLESKPQATIISEWGL